MIFLVFRCQTTHTEIRLNDEFEASEWVAPNDLARYDMNEATVDTLQRAGLMPPPRPRLVRFLSQAGHRSR